MKLRQYMTDRGVSDADMAQLVGLSAFGIRKLKYGERNPSIDVALRIQDVTGGLVTIADLQKDAPRPSETSLAEATT